MGNVKQQKSLTISSKAYCDRDRIRTCDRLLRRFYIFEHKELKNR